MKPVAFKSLGFIASNEIKKAAPAKTADTARLIIETGGGKPETDLKKQPVASVDAEKPVANTAPPASGKLGGLDAIRRQYANGNNAGVISEAIALTHELLQSAWNDFSIFLKENKNPAAQSFDLAILRIRDESCFEIVTPNNLQCKFIESERVKLSEHLQQRFNNRQLTFFIVIEEKIDTFANKVEIPLNYKGAIPENNSRISIGKRTERTAET